MNVLNIYEALVDIGTKEPFEYGLDVYRLIGELAALEGSYKYCKKALKKEI